GRSKWGSSTACRGPAGAAGQPEPLRRCPGPGCRGICLLSLNVAGPDGTWLAVGSTGRAGAASRPSGVGWAGVGPENEPWGPRTAMTRIAITAPPNPRADGDARDL